MSTVQSPPKSPPAWAVEQIDQRIERMEAAGPAGDGGSVASEPHVNVMGSRMEVMEHSVTRMGEQIRMEEIIRSEMQTEVWRMALHIPHLADAHSDHATGGLFICSPIQTAFDRHGDVV